MLARDVKIWSVVCHLSAFLLGIFPFGGNIIPSHAIWLVLRKEDILLNEHGKKAVNFQISMTIYFFIIIFAFAAVYTVPDSFTGVTLTASSMAFFVWVLLFLLAPIKAAIMAYRDEEYKYPLSIRFIK